MKRFLWNLNPRTANEIESALAPEHGCFRLELERKTRFEMLKRCMSFVVMMATSAGGATADDIEVPRSWVTQAVEEVCPESEFGGFQAQMALKGSWFIEETRTPNNYSPVRINVRLALPNGDELELERRQAGAQLRQFRVSYFEAITGRHRPRLLAIADGTCTIRSGRLLREIGDVWRFLDQLEGDLVNVKWSETLQAPWPEGEDPGGIRVALIDSGLVYDLELFRNRLARDVDGRPLGYDYWDMDAYPYDGDTSRGPFLPIRHGTAVASILVREAPNAALVPYRYPRTDMKRMGDLVERAAHDGVRILAMPLGSRRVEDWHAFAQAVERHDLLAVVSAGNDGRDIDADPVYPAALELTNVVTVTSADEFGRLAPGSNWGASSVDLMLPAENLEVIDFRGASVVASGSSYAVPRLAALAARILEREPDLTAAELKARIFARAVHSPYERSGILSAGWIPDPLAD